MMFLNAIARVVLFDLEPVVLEVTWRSTGSCIGGNDLQSPQTQERTHKIRERTRKPENAEMGMQVFKEISITPKPQIRDVDVVTFAVTCHRRHVHDKAIPVSLVSCRTTSHSEGALELI